MDAFTELVGVVGHPVRHSISPAFWNAALTEAGRNAVFLAFDVEPERFAAFVAGMSSAGARGLNVTLPHKHAAYELCTERSPDALATEAVNVVVFDESTTRGLNTDVYGVRAALTDMAVELAGCRALVLGAGGAGRAAVHALRLSGADVVVTNRTRERAEGLGVPVVTWTDAPEAMSEFDVLVHTTSLGLDGKASPLDEASLEAAAKQRLRVVLDVVYRAGETPLVRAARAAGLYASDGLRMLVHQAGEAWRLFFGDDAPLEVMHAEAARAAGR